MATDVDGTLLLPIMATDVDGTLLLPTKATVVDGILYLLNMLAASSNSRAARHSRHRRMPLCPWKASSFACHAATSSQVATSTDKLIAHHNAHPTVI